MQGPASLLQSISTIGSTPWSLQPASLAHTSSFPRIFLFLVLLASVSMSPSLRSCLPFFVLPQSLLYLKSSPEGRVGSLYVCLLIPEPSTCTAVVDRLHILKVTRTECVGREPTGFHLRLAQIPPFTQQVFMEGLQRARQMLLGTATLTDTICSSSEALVFPAAANVGGFQLHPSLGMSSAEENCLGQV